MRWPHFLAAPRMRQGVQSLGLALLMAGITSAGVKVFGWKWHVAPPPARATAAAKSPAFNLSHDQRLVPVSPEPDASEAHPKNTLAPVVRRNLSASEMFEAAKQARAGGDVPEALRLSKQIEEFFPNSEEGINTHLTLGVLYLEQNRAELALQEFATYRHIGSPETKAEAYWGQSQALRQLTRAEDEQIVLQELMQSYPRSVYVAAARTRLHELAPDAAPH